MYGRNRGSASAKGRWLARGVETLLFQYPGLRVAFLDEAPGGRQYSVFVRGTGAPPEGLDGQTEEIYRCPLLSGMAAMRVKLDLSSAACSRLAGIASHLATCSGICKASQLQLLGL